MAVSRFNSILHDLESSPHKQNRDLETVTVELRFLRTFLICARKWTSGLCPEPDHDNKKKQIVSFRSSLSSLEDTYLKNARIVGSFFRRRSHFSYQLDEFICKFEENITSVEQEIDQVYSTLVDYCSLSSSCPDEIFELVDSLLENLRDLKWGKSYFPYWHVQAPISEKSLRDLVQSLDKRLTCFKNFTRFAMWRGNEHREVESLFNHFEVLAVNAARVTYMYWFGKTKERKIKTNDSSLLISELLYKIETDDSRVLEMYIQVLKASNSSGSSRTLIPGTDILGNFVDSVLIILFEILNYRSDLMVSVIDQMQRLYEGLRFLRTILKQQQKKFDDLDEKVKDLLGVVVNDLGIVVCSLSAYKRKVVSKEMDLSLFDLLEKIELIKAEVQKKHPAAPTLSFPRTFEAGLIDYLLEELKDLRTSKVGPTSLAEDQIQELQENLVMLGSLLDNNMKQRNQQEELQTLWIRASELAYKAEFVIDSLKGEKIPDSSVFDSIKEEIMLFKTEALEIDLNKHSSKVDRRAAETSAQASSQRGISTSKEVVVGLDDEVITIINQLTRRSMQLDVVSIVGMPGIGKTTFAKRIYNHPSITCHFHVRAWCCVSQSYRKKDLLLEILAHICYKENGLVEKSEDDLAEYLYRQLKKNKYLIVFDDVWDCKAWHDLQKVFPNDANGSRILITSRLHKVASQVKLISEPFCLRLLTGDESLELLQKKLSHGGRLPPALHTLGLQIAQKCNGHPLAVVIVSGILATRGLDGWEEVSKRLSSSTVCSTEQCMSLLDLSYRHLPEYLKPCLLYFGALSEDQEFSIEQLTWILIAEGLVKQVEGKSLEDVARDYIMDLIDRSLVMIAKQRVTGRVKTCRIHDLLREFCAAKAKKENFFQVLNGYTDLSTFDEPSNLRRVYIYSEPEDFEKSKLFCPHLRSLTFSPYCDIDSDIRCDVSFVFRICKLLRVLNLFGIDFYNSFPSEVELLVGLRLLAIQVSEGASIPSSIANLQNLETFLLKGRYTFSLPSSIWKMKKLRHLHADCKGIYFGEDDLESSSELSNLMSSSPVHLYLGQTCAEILKKLPNIRILGCRFYSTEDCHRLVRMDFLSQVEKLELYLGDLTFCPDIIFPENLKELSLSYISLSITSEIARLPNLELLKLGPGKSEEGIWDMEKDGVFPKLRILELRGILRLVRWTGSDDHLPRLQKLVLYTVPELEELPSFLAYSECLEIIKVNGCGKVLESLVRKIEEEQRSLGNEGLKVHMGHIFD